MEFIRSEWKDNLSIYHHKNQTTSLKVFPPKEGFTVYPNPAHDFVNIKLKEPYKRVQFYNLNGQLIMDRRIISEEFQIQSYELGSAKGIFLGVLITEDNKVEHFKIVMH